MARQGGGGSGDDASGGYDGDVGVGVWVALGHTEGPSVHSVRTFTRLYP